MPRDRTESEMPALRSLLYATNQLERLGTRFNLQPTDMSHNLLIGSHLSKSILPPSSTRPTRTERFEPRLPGSFGLDSSKVKKLGPTGAPRASTTGRATRDSCARVGWLGFFRVETNRGAEGLSGCFIQGTVSWVTPNQWVFHGPLSFFQGVFVAWEVFLFELHTHMCDDQHSLCGATIKFMIYLEPRTRCFLFFFFFRCTPPKIIRCKTSFRAQVLEGHWTLVKKVQRYEKKHCRQTHVMFSFKRPPWQRRTTT